MRIDLVGTTADFRRFGPPRPLQVNHLPCEKLCDAGSNRRSRANQPVGTDQLHQAIGPETIEQLSQKTGIGKGELLPLIAQVLPPIVDRLTPNQRVPDEGEISRSQSNPPIET